MKKARSVVLAFMFLVITMYTIPLGNMITWSGENQLTSDYKWDGFASVTQVKNGTMWVVWQTDRTGLPGMNYEIFYKTYNGTRWSQDRILVANYTAKDIGPSILQASNGTLLLFWASNWMEDPVTGETNYDIVFTKSNNNGSTWSEPQLITTSPNDDYSPFACEANDGSILLVWYRKMGSGNYDIFLMTYSSQTNSWSGEVQLTSDPAPDKLPSITQAKDGTLLVFFQSYRGENFDVYRKNSTDNGANWGSDMRFTTSTDVEGDPVVYRTIHGTIWAVWSVRPPSPTGYDDLYYSISSDNGASWSSPVQLTTDKYDDVYPAIAQSIDRKIWMVWASNRVGQPDGNLELFYKTTIPLEGDVNGDWTVDIVDLAMVGQAYKRRVGDPYYNPAADLNNDGIVDVWDLHIVAKNYGRSV